MPEAYAEPFQEQFGVGRGFEEVLVLPDPAAGANLVYVIPGEYVTRPMSLAFQLTTDGNAGNRYVRVQYENDNGEVFWRGGVAVAQAATLTYLYGFTNGGPQVDVSADNMLLGALLDLFLPPACRIRIVNHGAKAGDQLSACRLAVDQFPTQHYARRRQRRMRHFE